MTAGRAPAEAPGHLSGAGESPRRDPDAVRSFRDWFEASHLEDCGAALRGLRPLVPSLLVGERGWERIVARAGGLAASVVGFEFRLGDPAPEADLSIAFVSGTAAQRAHIRRGRDADPGSHEAALARHLASAGDAPASGLVCTMLEHDLAHVCDAPPPAVFQTILPRWRFEASKALEAGTAGDLAAALGRVAGWAADAREVAAVRRLVAALPPPGRLTIIAAMPGREPRMIRVLIEGLDAGRLADGLKQIGWPGPTGAVLGALEVMEGRFGRIKVQLEVSAQGLLPRIGLELYPLSKPWSPALCDRHAAMGPDPWRPVLARLEEAGWCLPRKSRGLLAYPGTEHVFGDGVLLVFKWINHVKLSVEEGRVRAAKAYAGLRCIRSHP